MRYQADFLIKGLKIVAVSADLSIVRKCSRPFCAPIFRFSAMRKRRYWGRWDDSIIAMASPTAIRDFLVLDRESGRDGFSPRATIASYRRWNDSESG